MIFYGASGHATVVIEAWLASGGSVTAIYDDDLSIKKLLHFPVAGKFDPAKAKGHYVFLSIGSNNARKDLSAVVHSPFGKVVHPSTFLSPTSSLGEGSVAMAGVVINANTKVGKHVILNTRCSIDHDCDLADFVHVSPGATVCGGVSVGEGTQVGAGATIIQNISVGKWAIIGAGSVVVADVPDYAVVMGVPGRVTRIDKPRKG